MIAPGTDRNRVLLANVLPYAVVAILSLIIAFFVLQLWRITWTIPMYYGAGGDVFGIYSAVKTMSQTGWIFDAPELAAPFGAHLQDYPVPDTLHLLVLRALVLVFANYAVAINLYFVALFPLSAVIALFVLRRLGVSTIAAVALALVFSFLPERFERGQAHIFYAAYYLAPLIVLVAVWLIREHPLFDTAARRPTRDGWIAAVAALLIAWDNPYFILFASALFLTAAVVALCTSRRWSAPASACALIVIMAAGLFIAVAPSVTYKRSHGPNTAAVVRVPEASELYALSLIQLVLPVEHHRIPSWAEKRDYYDTRMALLVNENSAASLGVVAACGFIGLLCAFVFVRRLREDVLWPDLSRLTLVAFLLSTVGGIGAIITFYYVPEFRAYNRISPIIAFIGLVAVALALDVVRRRLRWRETQPRYVAALAAIAVLGIADQTNTYFVPPYELSAEHFQIDDALAREIETALPQGADVLQLPAMSFPESLPVGSLGSYDELAMYLHTHGIRWSFGGMAGRREGDWAPEIATKPPRELLAAALVAGFSGVAVYRHGYGDSGAEIERQIVAITGEQPDTSLDGAIAFYPLTGVKERVARALGPDANRLGAPLAPRIALAYGPAFYPDEASSQEHWRWASGDATITVRNDGTAPARAIITFRAAGAVPAATLAITASDGVPRSVAMTRDGVPVSIDRTFPAGDSTIRFQAGNAPVKIGADPRPLAFRLADVAVHDPNDQLEARVAAFLGTPAARAPVQTAVADLSLRFGPAFYGEERGEGRAWRWASGPADLVVHNAGSRAVKARLSFIASGVEPTATIKLAVSGAADTVAPLTQVGTKLAVSRAFAPGDTPIRLEPSTPPGHIGTDPRPFAFRLTDLTITP